MPHKAFKALGRYTRSLADRVGLRDWTFIIQTAPDSDDTNIASVTPTEGQFKAVICLSKDFADRPVEDITNTLVHELIHCHHRDMSDMIRLALPSYLGGPAFSMFHEAYRQAEERSVDALAGAFTTLLLANDELASAA
jgi:hypothetical protein